MFQTIGHHLHMECVELRGDKVDGMFENDFSSTCFCLEMQILKLLSLY